MKLQNKIVVIIGASSGIGEGIARAVAEQNPKGIVLAARRKEKLEALATDIGEKSLVVPTDVTSEESIRNLFNQTIKRYGELDIVVNSAGIIQKETLIEDLDVAYFDRIYGMNLRQAFVVGKHITPLFKKQGSGIYLVISSQAGKYAFPGETGYNATKAGLDHMIRSLSLEWKPLRDEGKPLYAFALGPGFINTEEARRQFPNVPKHIWEQSPNPLEFGRTVTEYLTNPKEKHGKNEEAVHHIETAKF